MAPAASIRGVLALLQLPGIDDVHRRAPVVALTANTKPLLEAPITAYPAEPFRKRARVPNVASAPPPTLYAQATLLSEVLMART
jgi:hypothetical protein